jgi:hypothetical protein
MDLGRRIRIVRRWLAYWLRPPALAALGLVTAASAILLWKARGINQYAGNLALNVGADLIGAIVTIFVIGPMINRGQQGRVREHRRLDYDWFTDQVLQTPSEVRILDTFTGLLDRPGTVRFLRAAREVVNRRGHVRFLLLDPDSLAAAQRASELSGEPASADLRRRIMRNLRVLDQFHAELDEHLRPHLEVRLYNVSASVTVYRWGDRALVSFLPVGRLSGEGTQLEIAVGSPLGEFVGVRFDELWRHAKPLSDFMTMRFQLSDSSTPTREYAAQFVTMGDHYFVTDPQILAHLASCRDGSLRAKVAGNPAPEYLLDVVAAESDLHSSLVTHYQEKYHAPGQAFVRLRPLTEG